MRVFVTGASGHLGSAVVPELRGAGHSVVALARSDKASAALESAGVEVWRGDLGDLDGLARAAGTADGVIHLAYRHDLAFSGAPEGFAAAAMIDLAAIKAMGEALAGTQKPLVITSGTALFAITGDSRRVSETDTLTAGPRADSENAAIALAAQGIRSAAVRLAPSVHSALDRHGFLSTLISLARKTGYAGYVGDGENVWNVVHTLDAARLFRLVLESAPAGFRWHGVGEEQVRFRDIAQTIGRRLGVPVKSLTPEEAQGYFGPFAGFGTLNNPASNAQTRSLLKWEPTHPTLLEDLEGPHYFTTA